jgi:hypothetical protein
LGRRDRARRRQGRAADGVECAQLPELRPRDSGMFSACSRCPPRGFLDFWQAIKKGTLAAKTSAGDRAARGRSRGGRSKSRPGATCRSCHGVLVVGVAVTWRQAVAG